ncbi:hypothetical protein N7491_007860 [Penicillium cf. griseofulvum]|uniref:Zn(2)-C6 fungal-type domain-containing protein n=1 Tax=Penicillium cf. griseofulvum TaxID=2972120 RepID=A0A9W9J5B4_9EURO|nr:hypothetical protein N7472_009111 [Penicillium cf. griseofulvum]KAJ5427418.1 hypothetical protein N7491_007860 [Penicillium cf. griseofulvum]KAJ5431618.1 hypothetical protein N7445_008116 [Penicillium cf. griseofulvum]
MSRDSTTAPIKLRTACNQCHFSKVRCSGEKTGCTRCVNLGYTCVYAESRVGKVQGNRARRREPETECSNIMPQFTTTGSTEVSTSSSLPHTPAVTPASNPPNNIGFCIDDYLSTEPLGPEEAALHMNSIEGAECALQWGIEEPAAAGSVGGYVSHGHNISQHRHSTTGDSTDFLSPSQEAGQQSSFASAFLNDGQLEQTFNGSKYPFPPFGTSKPLFNSPHATHFQMHYRSSLQHIPSCVEMVDGLEYYIHIGLTAVDEVMRINKHCMAHVLVSLDWEKTNPNMSLLTLNGLVVNHVISLFESASSQVLLPSDLEESPQGYLPSIHFGNYTLDAEQHAAIQVQLFLKELERCGQLVNKLTSRVQQLDDDPHRLAPVLSTWHERLRTRLEALREMVAK